MCVLLCICAPCVWFGQSICHKSYRRSCNGHVPLYFSHLPRLPHSCPPQTGDVALCLFVAAAERMSAASPFHHPDQDVRSVTVLGKLIGYLGERSGWLGGGGGAGMVALGDSSAPIAAAAEAAVRLLGLDLAWLSDSLGEGSTGCEAGGGGAQEAAVDQRGELPETVRGCIITSLIALVRAEQAPEAVRHLAEGALICGARALFPTGTALLTTAASAFGGIPTCHVPSHENDPELPPNDRVALRLLQIATTAPGLLRSLASTEVGRVAGTGALREALKRVTGVAGYSLLAQPDRLSDSCKWTGHDPTRSAVVTEGHRFRISRMMQIRHNGRGCAVRGIQTFSVLPGRTTGVASWKIEILRSNRRHNSVARHLPETLVGLVRTGAFSATDMEQNLKNGIFWSGTDGSLKCLDLSLAVSPGSLSESRMVTSLSFDLCLSTGVLTFQHQETRGVKTSRVSVAGISGEWAPCAILFSGEAEREEVLCLTRHRTAVCKDSKTRTRLRESVTCVWL